MTQNSMARIDADAAKALIRWKSMFADEVCRHAEGLAAGSSQPQVITASHYRQAARLALKTLDAAIEVESKCDADQRAA